MMLGDMVGWTCLQEGCRCYPLCTESRVKHLLRNYLQHKSKTWDIFLYPSEYTVHHWIQAWATQSYYHAKRIFFFLLEIYHVKDIHSTFLREKTECKPHLFLVGDFSSTLQPPCRTHTYKAYLDITCFKLCIMTLESKLMTEQATWPV